MRPRAITFAAIAFSMASAAYGYEFQEGELFHNTLSPASVEVTYGGPETEVCRFNYILNKDARTATIIAAGTAVDPYEGDMEIPSVIVEDGVEYTVTEIGENAAIWNSKPVFDSKVTSLVIPSTIKRINNYGLAYIGATTLDIPASVEYIGQWGIASCPNLESITLHEGLKTLYWEALKINPKLKELTIPNSVESIGSNCFIGNKAMTKITFGSGAKEITDVLGDCSSLTEVILPEGIEKLDGTFTSTNEGCPNLKSIVLPSTLKEIGWRSFQYTAIEEIDIPEGFENLGSFALGTYGDHVESYIKKVTLPA